MLILIGWPPCWSIKRSVVISDDLAWFVLSTWMKQYVVYVDEMIVLVSSAKALQELLGTCHEFTQSHDITFNSTKAVCMNFIPGNRTLHLDQFNMGTKGLSFTEEVKYLGHLIRSRFRDDNDVLRVPFTQKKIFIIRSIVWKFAHM